MIFNTPSYVPHSGFAPPDNISVQEFLLRDDPRYGRHPMETAKPPFTCGITGRSFSVHEVARRVEYLARSLSARLACPVNSGNELDKVISIFSLNAVLNTPPIASIIIAGNPPWRAELTWALG